MLGFKAFEAAQCPLAGVALMHMIKKRQLVVEDPPSCMPCLC